MTIEMSADAIKAELDKLDPGTPWTHHFDLNGVETITAERDNKFYRKSMGSKHIAKLAMTYFETFAKGRQLRDSRILDVASAEGGFSIPFAAAGAKEVVGIEGRRLYVERARFVARAMNVDNVRFDLSDVRKMDKDKLGYFDFAIVSGILHHLGQDDFLPFLASVASLTETMFLFTHVSTPDAIKDYRLKGPVEPKPGLVGYLSQEHDVDATPEQREKQVRASLDNTFSFWATEETLIDALKRVGFSLIAKIFEPHAYGGYQNRNFRIIFIASKLEQP